MENSTHLIYGLAWPGLALPGRRPPRRLSIHPVLLVSQSIYLIISCAGSSGLILAAKLLREGRPPRQQQQQQH